MRSKVNKANREKKYSVAPYNFVNLPERSVEKYKTHKDLPPHNDFRGRDQKRLLSGYIRYTLKAETPIIVAKGTNKGDSEKRKAKFFTNPDDKYAIQASSIRGMVRTNAQILSFSDIVGEKDDEKGYINSYIEDSRFLYRDVAGNTSLGDKYKNMLGIDLNKMIAKKLKVGYMIKSGDKFRIQPAKELKEGMPYFRVVEEDFKKIGGHNVPGIKFLDDKNYKPYRAQISFNLAEDGEVTKIAEVGKAKYNGYILSGGFISGKRCHYVVPPMDDELDSANSLDQDDLNESIRLYKQDMLATQKAYIEDGVFKVYKEYEFYALPEKNEKKPVFYIKDSTKDSSIIHFGFIPYLRLSYEKSVLDGVCDKYKNTKGISYADGIFGFTNKSYQIKNRESINISYKSRLSFEDAVVTKGGRVDKECIIDVILAKPKPTSYNLYLKQDKDAGKKELHIYDGDFEIRGFKQYWLKNYIDKPHLEPGKVENMKTTLYPLEKNTEFEGKIYFNNLDEEELGLLIWALKLEGNCYQNIGLAKPYGFGRVKVKDIELKIEDLDKKYNTFSFDYYKEGDIDKYINIYKKNFSNEYLRGTPIGDIELIKDFMYIKSKVIKFKASNNYRYMELYEFEDKKVLPEIYHFRKSIKYPLNKDKPKSEDKINKSRKRKRSRRNGREPDTAMALAFKEAERNSRNNKR
ncbi:TIGR03986 family type III CRISPR-associated RAMP protein [Clostridium sp. Cult1]|uniref:TIGR03986 family type III CRISPR-associated RAMP protein n=1 Tax=Clostridium sp. Cult1 TaxID=2079002 RepID=UPI001F1CE520|nr:TIGR03986 family CRISPR-associated RAMP protein [Clostridium sp. Cult1]MCF6463749.1 TIGR03986 family CRISPR-associated RAMP protein [Clostridium sp. Cult1]